VLNMFVLWMFGRDVEAVYGRAEFLRVYLVMLVAGSLGWAVLNRLEAPGVDYELIGASGAVVGIFVLFCLNFPRRTVLLFFVLPVPAWVAGLLLIIPDVFGAVAMPNSNIAFTVHLIGAALALLYFRARWNFGRLWPRRISWPWHWSWPRSGPRFRVHDPDPDDAGPQDQELSAEVDRILEKIHREGEASLTARERRTLEDASRRYQEKRRGPP